MIPRNGAEKISKFFPSLKVDSVKRILTGWDNIVLEVNNEYVFRFPRFRVAEDSLRREIELLRVLRNRFSISIPHYEHVWPGGRYGKGCFAGYKKIRGTPLTIGGYRLAWTQRLARGLGRFLRDLHSIDTSRGEFRMLSRPTVDERKRMIQKTYNDIRRVGYRYLDKKTRLQADKIWQNLLKDLPSFSERPVLVHGDLGQGNILLEPATGEIVGVVDWGDASINDPALDFSHLFEVNRNLGEETLRIYDTGSRNFMRRVEFYWRTEPFYELLYGVMAGSAKEKLAGIKHIPRRLNAPGLSESAGNAS